MLSGGSGRKRRSRGSPGGSRSPPSQPKPSSPSHAKPYDYDAERLHASHKASEQFLASNLHLNKSYAEKLAHSNIISPEAVAPALAGVAKKLRREMIKNKVNEELFAREEAADLEKQGVIKSQTVAPRLQSTRSKLERNLTKLQLKSMLESRPDQRTLETHNILPSHSSKHSNAIEGTIKKLERNMISNKVGHLLETRPGYEDLAARSIVKRTDVAPNLQQKQNALQRSLAKSNLFHALMYRPTLEELQERHIYTDKLPGSSDGSHYSTQDESSSGDESDSEVLSNEASEQAFYRQQMAQYAAEQQANDQKEQPNVPPQRRSKNFHLTRILLKFVAGMGDAGEITPEQKGYLKDLIVDQDRTILAVAETFDAENDLGDFKDSLYRIAQRSN